MVAIDQLFQYTNQTKDLCLIFSKENGGKVIDPEDFVDSDLAGDISQARSTHGYLFHLGGATFS